MYEWLKISKIAFVLSLLFAAFSGFVGCVFMLGDPNHSHEMALQKFLIVLCFLGPWPFVALTYWWQRRLKKQCTWKTPAPEIAAR